MSGDPVDAGTRRIRGGDPLAAELWASHLVGMFANLSLVGEPDPVAAIGGRLVSVARRTRTPEAQVCLQALAAVAHDPLRQRARTAARELGRGVAHAPEWVETIGTAGPTGAWRASDCFGDQDSVMIGFAYSGGAEHCVLVLIDHPLGGIAKDACVLGPLAEVVAHWEADSDLELVEEPVDVAAGRVMDAIASTERTIDAPVTEDYRHCAALLRARLGPLAAEVPEVEPHPARVRESLVQAFLADPAGEQYAQDPDAWFLLDALVDFRCDYHGRDPLRWSAGVALLFLLDFVPRKLSADRPHLARMPEVLRAWVVCWPRWEGRPT